MFDRKQSSLIIFKNRSHDTPPRIEEGPSLESIRPPSPLDALGVAVQGTKGPDAQKQKYKDFLVSPLSLILHSGVLFMRPLGLGPYATASMRICLRKMYAPHH